MASTSGRFSALAICAEFQVRRKDTPWLAVIAMCNASARAFEGKAASFNNLAVKSQGLSSSEVYLQEVY
jgi:hypothetical protein